MRTYLHRAAGSASRSTSPRQSSEMEEFLQGFEVGLEGVSDQWVGEATAPTSTAD
jgi:hypothetical protein